MKPCTVLVKRPLLLKKHFGRYFFPVILFLFCFSSVNGQAVTEIITDYAGYWKSSASSINATNPDNSHNLLAFQLAGILYSTGVNDALLTSNGETFFAGDFRALPVSNISGTVNSNTKIGLGALYDGVVNGPGSPPPVNDMPLYLTDGAKGLNLGTGVANIPVGTITFSVNNLQAAAVGDGRPDILITQIADPNVSLDRYEFTNSGGTTVGNFVDVSFSSISAVGNWTVDFYEASQNPMTLLIGFTQTPRPIRLWAADFSAFGINAGNLGSVTNFTITLGGNSDIAFVAYNYTSITVLPLKLSFFKGNVVDNDVRLSWQTLSENNTDQFIVEHSNNGSSYMPLDNIKAAGNSSAVRNYSYIHHHPDAGVHYYRLKQIDIDGHFTYSNIIRVEINPGQDITVSYLSENKISVMHPVAGKNDLLNLFNMEGALIVSKKLSQGYTNTFIDLSLLPTGIYHLAWISKEKKIVRTVLIK